LQSAVPALPGDGAERARVGLEEVRTAIDDFHAEDGRCLYLEGGEPFPWNGGERIVLSDRGAFWLHVFEDVFSIAYVSRLWGSQSRTRGRSKCCFEDRRRFKESKHRNADLKTLMAAAVPLSDVA
jgi:hypothetical protein